MSRVTGMTGLTLYLTMNFIYIGFFFYHITLYLYVIVGFFFSNGSPQQGRLTDTIAYVILFIFSNIKETGRAICAGAHAGNRCIFQLFFFLLFPYKISRKHGNRTLSRSISAELDADRQKPIRIVTSPANNID